MIYIFYYKSSEFFFKSLQQIFFISFYKKIFFFFLRDRKMMRLDFCRDGKGESVTLGFNGMAW